jgi:2-amino-4-hydroxy-6-hydroxymethyldihydropteridine diphosphokinase/dihydropteroate synthase
VSHGRYDPEILSIAAKHQVPYIALHSRGTPETMNKQDNLQYHDIIKDISGEMNTALATYREAGMLE